MEQFVKTMTDGLEVVATAYGIVAICPDFVQVV
jgi:hypothetical protein